MEISEQLSIGISVPLSLGVASFSRRLNQVGRCADLESAGSLATGTCANNDLSVNRLDNDGLEEVEAAGWGIGFTFGVHFETMDGNTRLAAVYRYGDGIKYDGDAEYSNISSVISDLGQWQDTDLDVDIEIPSEIVLGLSHHFSDKLEVMMDVAWTNWNQFGSLVLQV